MTTLQLSTDSIKKIWIIVLSYPFFWYISHGTYAFVMKMQHQKFMFHLNDIVYHEAFFQNYTH